MNMIILIYKVLTRVILSLYMLSRIIRVSSGGLEQEDGRSKGQWTIHSRYCNAHLRKNISCLSRRIHYCISLFSLVNLSKPTSHVMHQQFNIQQLYVLPTLYLCVSYLSENKQRLVPLQHKMSGFYNRDGKCLLRGRNWVFK